MSEPYLPETAPAPARTGRPWLDLFVAGCALTISLISLAVGLRSSHTQQQMLEASVWPNLQFGSGNVDSETLTPVIDFELINSGIGPARVRGFEVRYKDRSLDGWPSLLRACCLKDGEAMPGNVLSTAVADTVIPAQSTVRFLRLFKDGTAPALWERLNEERFSVQARVCYCSVLEACWLLEFGASEAVPVAQCAADRSSAFRG